MVILVSCNTLMSLVEWFVLVDEMLDQEQQLQHLSDPQRQDSHEFCVNVCSPDSDGRHH